MAKKKPKQRKTVRAKSKGKKAAVKGTPVKKKKATAGPKAKVKATSKNMDQLLVALLADLAEIAQQHKEINDSDVEEAMSQAIYDGFLKQSPGYSQPDKFGLASREGNRLVGAALEVYIRNANALASRTGLGFKQRLAAFQNLDATYGTGRLCYNDFFRYTPPDKYDDSGKPL